MAKSQYPLDGKPGKAWKVTSKFGWRVHPKTGVKKHHNGTDIWQAKSPSYLEACFDGKVVGVSTSTDPNGAGNKVVVQSKVMGKKITWTYFHMVKGSIKVKVGQRVIAGQVVGKMGDTGFATGKHLHWEIWKGHLKSQPMAGFASGKGFYDPMKFTAAALEWEKVNVEAALETPVDAPVEAMPAHSVEVDVKPVTPVVATFKVIKVGSKGESVKAVQKAVGAGTDGVFGPMTEKAVKVWQKKVGLPITGIIDSVAWSKIVGK
jgi:murein DD-endopeptidase MepM/ murein hydrolase activator NlpD